MDYSRFCSCTQSWQRIVTESEKVAENSDGNDKMRRYSRDQIADIHVRENNEDHAS